MNLLPDLYFRHGGIARLCMSVSICEPSTVKSNFRQYLFYSTSRKSLNKRHVWTQTSFASTRVRTFNFLCADARTQTQTHAKFFSCILCPTHYMFRPWVSLLANPCPMLVAFHDPEIQLALDQLFRTPAHKLTALRTSVSLGEPA